MQTVALIPNGPYWTDKKKKKLNKNKVLRSSFSLCIIIDHTGFRVLQVPSLCPKHIISLCGVFMYY